MLGWIDSNAPGHKSVECSQDCQSNSACLFVSGQPSKSRREHDLHQKQRVADVAGQQVCDPASALLVFGELVETDIIASRIRTRRRLEVRRRVYAHEPLEEFESTMSYSVLRIVRSMLMCVVGQDGARWAYRGRSSAFGGVSIVTCH